MKSWNMVFYSRSIGRMKGRVETGDWRVDGMGYLMSLSFLRLC